MTLGLAEARLRPSGYGVAAFAYFATIDLRLACPAETREASEGWWSQAGSNRRPLACHASALPAELWPLRPFRKQWASPFRIRPTRAPLAERASRTDPDHRSGSISSLLVVADVANDVGDVFIA